jgi:hypothetical protein
LNSKGRMAVVSLPLIDMSAGWADHTGNPPIQSVTLSNSPPARSRSEKREHQPPPRESP